MLEVWSPAGALQAGGNVVKGMPTDQELLWPFEQLVSTRHSYGAPEFRLLIVTAVTVNVEGLVLAHAPLGDDRICKV